MYSLQTNQYYKTPKNFNPLKELNRNIEHKTISTKKSDTTSLWQKRRNKIKILNRKFLEKKTERQPFKDNYSKTKLNWIYQDLCFFFSSSSSSNKITMISISLHLSSMEESYNL